MPWEDEEFDRVPAGFPMRMDLIFDGPDSVLVKYYGPPECWLALNQLAWRPLEPQESDLPFFWDHPTTTDFDIPLEESHSETALFLKEAGLLEFFDPGPGTIGAALVIGENRPELRDLLLDLSETGDAPLLQKVLEVVWDELEEEAAEKP